ncbi:hypothetical protein BA190_06555 [Labrys sp. WJW]|nr:hypothetical protein BA190_06555 [Labrys sp. WJW]
MLFFEDMGQLHSFHGSPAAGAPSLAMPCLPDMSPPPPIGILLYPASQQIHCHTGVVHIGRPDRWLRWPIVSLCIEAEGAYIAFQIQPMAT